MLFGIAITTILTHLGAAGLGVGAGAWMHNAYIKARAEVVTIETRLKALEALANTRVGVIVTDVKKDV